MLDITVNTTRGGTPLNADGGHLFVETTIEERTAKAGTHFPILTNGIFFQLDGTEAAETFSLQTLDDDILDGPRFKSFFIAITTTAAVGLIAPEDGFEFDPDRIHAEIIIEDDDPPNLIGFETTEFTVTEGTDLKVTVTVRASNGALYEGAEAILVVNTMDGDEKLHNAAISGADFDGVSNHQVRLNAEKGREDADVNILDDTVFESIYESFTIILSSNSLPLGVELDPDRSTAVVTIADDDKAELRFENPSFETIVNQTATVKLGAYTVLGGAFDTDPDYDDFTLVLNTEDGSAVAGTDYVPISNMEITLSDADPNERAFDPTIEVPIGILTTAVQEDKTFNVILTVKDNVALQPGLIPFPPEGVRAEVVIMDEVVIGFDQPVYTINENRGSVFYTVRTIGGKLPTTDPSVEIGFNVVEDTAKSGTHFHADPFTGTTVQLGGSDGTDQKLVSVNDVIIDNEVLDGPQIKSFFLELTSTVTGVAFHPERNRAEFRIVDNDTAEVGFSSPSFFTVVSQGGSSNPANVTVGVSGGTLPAGEPVTFLLSTEDDSARGGTEYTSISDMEITLSSQNPTVEVPITILTTDSDFVARDDLTFAVVLRVKDDAPLPDGFVSQLRSEVAIKDNDALIGFTQNEYEILENGGQIAAKVEVKKGWLAETVTVHLETVAGSAQPAGQQPPGEDADYIHIERDVVLYQESPEYENDDFVVPINLDRQAEGTETFTVVLTEAPDAMLPQGVKLDPSFSRAPVAVSDEIILTIGFVNAPYTVAEDAATTMITIAILSEGVVIGASRTLVVDYETSDISARMGEDYRYLSGTVVFDKETKSHNIEIPMPVTDDMLSEGPETFRITLGNARTLLNGVRQGDENDISQQLNPGQAQVTITDNEPMPVVGFSDTSYEVNEGDDFAEFTLGVYNDVRLRDNEALKVYYSANKDSADPGEDFEAVEEYFVILSAQTTETVVRIPIIDDSILEANEDFLITLYSKGGQFTASPPQATIEIKDNDWDATVRRYSSSLSTGRAEESGAGTTLEIDLPNAPVGGALDDLVIDLAARAAMPSDGGTAADVMIGDFNNPGTPISSVTISKGGTFARFSVSAQQDTEVELDETVNVYVSAINGIPYTGDSGYDVTVESDDQLTSTITVQNGPGDGTAIAIVELDQPLPAQVPAGALALVLQDGSTMNTDVEILAPVTDLVTSLKATREATVPIRITDDSLFEGNEEVQLKLQIDSTLTPDLAPILPVATGSFTIIDNDKTPVGFGSPRYGVFEDAGSVRVEVSLLDGALPAGLSVTVDYRIEPGSAVSGTDYTDMMGTLTFESAKPQFINISIIDDDVPEAVKSFRVVLVDNPRIEVAPGGTLVEILNDDIATIRFDQTSYSASEAGANPNIAITSDVALPTGLTLTISTEAGSAMAGEDYTALDKMEVFLPPGFNTSYLVNVSVNNDNLIEFDETFEVVLSAPDGLPPGVELAPVQSRVPVKIESEDTAVAEILNTAPIDEDENATFNFRISPATLPVGQVVRVYYGVTEATTSATEGEDYTLPEMNYVTFSSSKATAQVTIPIINDKIFEGDETLGLILLSSDHPDIEYMGGRETITIRDNDQVTVDFIGPDSYTVNEGDGSVAVTFGITAGTLAANVTVGVSYVIPFSGNTADVDDYTAGGDTVILSADMPEVTIEIPIIDDSKPEGDEQFVIIGNFGGASGPSMRTITIKDDDPPGIIGLSYSNNNPIGEVDENDGTIRLDFGADPALAGSNVTLNYVIEPGSATAGTDYTDKSGTLELTDFFLDISILDDSAPESVERFVVRLSLPEGSELPPGYSLGPDLEVTIIDDDGATLIGFTQAAYEVEESSGTVNFEIEVDAGGMLAETVTLDYAIEDGSAKVGTDYTTTVTVSTAGTIELTPETPTAIITVKIIDEDRVAEYDKAFRIRLSESMSTPLPAGIELYRDSAEITIVNDDAIRIGFQESTYRVNEDAGSAEIDLAVLTGRLSDDTELTLLYSIIDDDALDGQDYTTVTRTVTLTRAGIDPNAFTPAQQSLSIPIIDDDLYERHPQRTIPDSDRFATAVVEPNQERFVVRIEGVESSIRNLEIEPAAAEVLIVDDEGPGDLEITLRSQTDQWIEGMAGTLRASIPDPLAVDLELTIIPVFDDMDPATVDADAGDYRGANTVTIPAGDRSVVIEASINDDNTVEVDKVLNVTVSQFNHIGLANPHIYQLAARPSASITIVDDDPLTLNLEVQESNQEADTVQATVKFVTASSFEFTSRGRPQVVTLELRDANGELYTGQIDGQDIGGMGRQSYYGSPILFTPQDLTTQDDITLYFENNFYEGQRAYTLALLKTPTQHPGIMLGIASADITVAENDLPALALNYGGNLEVAEGQGIDVDLELTNGGPQGLHEPLTVRLALTTTSSASTSDIDLPSTVTIPRGMSSATFRITARDDMVDGEIEQFTLAFVSASAPSMTELITRAVFSSGGAIAVTEAPVPQVTLSLEGGISTIMEGGSVNLIATLSEPLPGGVPEPLTVELAVEGVSDGDYSPLGDIVIPTSGMMGMVELMIENDNLAEFAEQLTVSVARLGYGTNRSAPQVESSVGLTIEINNNDMITATILASDLTEAVNAVAVVTIELDRALPDGLTADEVQLVLVNTGDRADDVSGLPMNIADVFGGGTMALVPLPLMDDMILEGTEVVTLELAVSDRLKPIFANEDTARGSFNINDDENGTVIIATPVKTAYDESENIGLTVELPSGVNAGAPIKVDYEISFPKVGSTAPADSADITTTSREVMIVANANSVPLTIMLHDDEVLEETELLRVTLTGVSTTNGAVVKVGGQPVDLTILDDEDLTYVIEGDAAINEDAGNYTVRLRRTGDITADATVPYTIDGADVTAADFGGTGMFPSGSFTFMGNEALSADVSIPIADDMILEPDETFQITADKDGAAETSHDVTINDDDNASAEVRLGTSTGTVAEGAMTTLEVGLTNVGSGGAPENLTIQLSARALTPTADGGTAADVTINPTSIMINKGESTDTFMVSAVADGLVEYDETVNIYVSHVNGAEVNTDSGVDLTVTSADQITVESLRVLGTSTLEEGGMANVEITLSEALPDLTPANALSLVLRDSTYGPDVTIPTADIIPALKADRTTIVTIGLDHDALLEADEEIELELEITPVTPGMPNLADVLNVSVAEARTSFTLADDDSGEVTIDALSKTSYSETDDVMVTVSLPSGLRAGTNIEVDYELVFLLTDDGGTERVAADAADIDGSTSDSVMIMAGDTNAIITIDLEDDTIAEETELLGVRLTDASGADVTYDNTVMQFLILDDEDPKYTLVGDGTVNESDGSYTVQARRRGRTDVLSVGYTVTVAASDSASAADFTGGAFPVGTFMFSGDTALSTNTAMIGIEDDMLLEDVENFLILAGDAMHPVMLFDNDAPTVFVRYTHAVSSVTVNEGEMVPLIAELQNAPGGATEELTVSLLSREVSGVTDSGTPSDVSFPSMVRIPVGASKVTFAVEAVADSLAEFNERVNIYADGVSYSGGINMTGDNGADLTVVSTDPIVATITIPDGTEGDTIAARITLNQPLPSQTQVGALSLVLPDGSISNDSVRIVSREIVPDLKTGLTADVMIELKDDKIFWGDVTVDVILRSNPGLTPDLGTLLPSVARASFKVSDNDPNIIRVEPLLSATEYDEGETVEFEFALPAGITAGIPITVEYELIAPTTDADNNRRVPADSGDRSTVQAQGLAPGFAQGLALPVRGLAQTLQPLVIQTGDNSVILRIQLTDDMTAEETELLGVRLMGVNAGPNARVEVDQQMDETVITILDNEDPVLEILGSGSVNEEDGRYIVRLRRLGRINTMGERVPFTISGDGADAGDFVGKLGGEFVFDGLDALSQLVILTLDDDRSQEDAKTFQIGVERFDPMTNMFVSVDLVDPVTGMPASGFAVTLLDTDVADFFGVLPPTGGPVLPVWLLLVLLLTGVALLVPALRRI